MSERGGEGGGEPTPLEVLDAHAERVKVIIESFDLWKVEGRVRVH